MARARRGEPESLSAVVNSTGGVSVVHLNETRFVVVDTETTGLDAAADEIVEMALVEVWRGTIRPLWSSLIKPSRPIDPEASAVSHISNNMVATAPDPARIIPVIKHHAADAIFVAHHAAFDRSFVSNLIGSDEHKWICTRRIARQLWPDAPRHKNQVLRYWLPLDVPDDLGSHRAAEDAMVTAHLLLREIERYLAQGLPDHIEAFAEYAQQPIRICRMPFGRYFGKAMSDVPTDYLQWAVINVSDLDPDLRWTMQTILAERSLV